MTTIKNLALFLAAVEAVSTTRPDCEDLVDCSTGRELWDLVTQGNATVAIARSLTDAQRLLAQQVLDRMLRERGISRLHEPGLDLGQVSRGEH